MPKRKALWSCWNDLSRAGCDGASQACVTDCMTGLQVRRMLFGSSNGFAEAYMDGDWDIPDLRTLLRLAQVNEAALGASINGLAIARWIDRAPSDTRQQPAWQPAQHRLPL